MSFGFPSNPSNKKQYISGTKSYEYDGIRGAWVVSVRPAASANTVNITDVSQLADPNSLLNNASSTLPVYASEESLYASTADLDIGQMAYVSENGKIAIWNGTSWFGATTIEYVPPPPNGLYGDRAVVGGGTVSDIEYFDITSVGNSSTFGNLTDTNGLGYNQHAALSNKVYGVFSGGNSDSGVNSGKTDIDYITIATLGNSSTFGNLSEARFSHAGCCDSTTGLFAGGRLGTTYTNTIDYITVATPGTATDFGNMQTARGFTSAIANLTYGLIGGGYDTGRSDTIDIVTVATPSSATDFGNLTVGRNDLTAVQSETRGVFCGGRSVSVTNEDTMDYVTFATPSSATDFGNLIAGRFFVPAGSSNGTRGCISGGYDSADLDSIEYITIDTTGSASSFGNLLAVRRLTAGTSGAAA
jgi:hypothetical protein